MKLSAVLLTLGAVAAVKDCSRERPIEVFVLQDGTASFSAFLSRSQVLFPQFINALTEEVDHVRSGIALFGDKPIVNSADVCWGELSGLHEDKQHFINSASTLRMLCSGGDAPENGWEALAYAAGSAAGYTPLVPGDNITRIAILVTDVDSHEGTEITNPNLAREIHCGRTDRYPPLSQIRQILDETAVHPIILASTAAAETYWSNALFNRMGYSDKEAAVHPFQMNASDLVAVLLDAVKEMECNIEEIVPTTPPPTLPPPPPSTDPAEVDSSSTMGPPTVAPTSTSEAEATPSPTEEIVETTSPEEESNIGIIIGAAAGGAAVIAGSAALAWALQSGTPPALEVEMEGEQGATSAEEFREAENPTTSADYGTYGE